ncbi:MAG: ATP-binding protein, partial [Spirochaetales bacterium]|nr:ATP-binding protein [Candidatus Physcosoma equi]
MLLSFHFDNYKCFSDRIDFSMVSSSKITKMIDHRMILGKNKNNSIRVMKHAAIYGANASGKSSVIQAMEYFQNTVVQGLSTFNNEQYCRNKRENASRDSLFEIRIELDGKFYAYGFKARIAETRIVEEWLVELRTGNIPVSVIFSKEENGLPVVGDGLNLSTEERLRFNTYSTDFEGQEKTLFLTEMNRTKKYTKDSGLYIFKQVFDWIAKNLVLVFPLSKLSDFYACTKESVLN